jgi:hypothetical protein
MKPKCTRKKKSCSTQTRDHQPFPRTGPLAKHLNLPIEALRQKATTSEATVYCYVIQTIKEQNGRFIQTGSAPNFQGDLVTLCTCKHYMRTFLDPNGWIGHWIAGFTGVQAGQGKNLLVYLMRVSHAYPSYADFWFSPAIPDKTKRAKAAHRHPFGDIYQPQGEGRNPFDPRDYVPPRDDHVHTPHFWRTDVDYVGCSERRAALLVGDPDHSFLWEHPLIFFPSRLARGQKKCTLGDLVDQLSHVQRTQKQVHCT